MNVKANEFVKKFGLDEAVEVLNGCKSWIDRKSGNVLSDNSFVIDSRTYEHAIGTLYMGEFTNYCEESYRVGEVNLLLLKRLIESHRIVESLGGLEKAKIRCYPAKHVAMESYHNLKQAIEDVESCL